MSSLAVLMPAGGSDEYRARAREYVVNWYADELPTGELVVGSCLGEWSKGAAIADAVSKTSAEIFVLADADSYILEAGILRAAVEKIELGASWVVPHSKVFRLAQKETDRFYSIPGSAPRLGKLVRAQYEGPAGGGIVVLSRSAFELVNGIDPRFLGWGGEDLSFGWALDTLVGPHTRLAGNLVHLWHPHPAPTLRGSPESEALVARYRSARGVSRRMRAVVDGKEWVPAEPLPAPIRFRMTANRTGLRLPTGETIVFTAGIYETTDPDEVEQIRNFAIVREESRK